MIGLTNTAKILILIGIVIGFLYFINRNNSRKNCSSGHCSLNNIETFSSDEMPNSDKQLNNNYKASNFIDGVRGGEPSGDLDKLFDDSLAVDVSANDNFTPFEEAGCGEINACGEPASINKNDQLIMNDDLFNADNYLPQVSNKDWFDVPPEPVNVKNRHLINVTRPIGVDSVASSKKNASHDIRGSPVCPKFVVSPWLQSSIDPDINNKGFC